MPRRLTKTAFVIAFAGGLLAACETTTGIQETAPVVSKSEMASTITDWWQGDYSNAAQIASLKADGAPIWQEGGEEENSFGGHLPVTSYYRSVDMPAFGDHVIYLEEFTFDGNPYRQRIYTVNHDQDTDAVSVKLWYFPDKTTYAGAWKDLSKIKDIKPDDMSPLPDNCDLFVEQSEDGRLLMEMPRDQCKFGASVFDYRVSLGPDDFWFRDRIVDAETMKVKMTAGSFQYHKLDKTN